MLEWIRFVLTAVFLVGGLIVFAVAVAGIYRFHYVLNRMHAAAMGDTLGLLLAMIGLIISCFDWAAAVKLFLTVCFLWVASPVSSHLICRMEIAINDRLDSEMEVVKE